MSRIFGRDRLQNPMRIESLRFDFKGTTGVAEKG